MTDRRKSLRLAIMHTIIVLVVLLVAIGATWFLSRRQMQQLNTQFATLKTQESAMSQKRDELPLIAGALPELIKQGRTVARMFPVNVGDRELIEFLADELRRSGVELMSWQLTQPKTLEIKKGKGKETELQESLNEELLGRTKVIVFTMEVRGRFPSVVRFLEDLKQSGRFIRITGIAAEAQQGLGASAAQSWRLDGDMFFITDQKELPQQFADLAEVLASVIGYRSEFEETKEEAEPAVAGMQGEGGGKEVPFSPEGTREPTSAVSDASGSPAPEQAAEGGE